MTTGELADPLLLTPLTTPPDCVVTVPGSKSQTNRALLAAGLAVGESRLNGVLFADDTEAMIECLAGLGVGLGIDRGLHTVVVGGLGGPPVGPAHLDARLSGTTSRFVLPAVALGHGRFVVDGDLPLRRRPFADLLDGLEALGVQIDALGEPGHLPVAVDAKGMAGGMVELRADASSQFASALLLAGPLMDDGLDMRLSTEPVSRPYLDLTVDVMVEFGADVERDGRRYIVSPGGYRGTSTNIEPDATAASYLFAAAAVTGGRVRIDGLHRASRQGDVAFVDVLEEMGATVHWGSDHIEVTGGPLRGVDVDLRHVSDTAQTLAAVAVFAEGPTTITGIGFIRGKETDRLGAMVAELRRCGVDAVETDDGMTIRPGRGVHGAVVQTYGDHRMAMSFAVLGLRVPGISIADPGCVAKTFPEFFDVWSRL